MAKLLRSGKKISEKKIFSTLEIPQKREFGEKFQNLILLENILNNNLRPFGGKSGVKWQHGTIYTKSTLITLALALTIFYRICHC